MTSPFFAIESPDSFPADVHAGVVLRTGVSTFPQGSSFWRAGVVAPRLVRLNRCLLAAQFGVSPEAFRYVRQVHGTTIVRRGATGDIPAADGQWCSDPGIYLVVNIADCCPVLVYSSAPRRLALLHSGWRGTAQGIVAGLVSAWLDDRVDPASLQAWIGPCADSDRYEVGPEVAEQFAAYPGALRSSPSTPDHALLDISAVIREQLRVAGLSESAIEVSPGGTISDRRYHSYRRDGFASGRMLAFAALR